jgi:gluconokinase
MVVIVMGVSGSGKTTVGRLLAADLGWIFLDADSLHSAANIAKMASGVPLSDADRAPWLAAIHQPILESWQRQENLVVACSALKERYREALAEGVPVVWVYLKGEQQMIYNRLKLRQHHFMAARMLASQFADLEEPGNAIVVNVSLPAELAARQLATKVVK